MSSKVEEGRRSPSGRWPATLGSVTGPLVAGFLIDRASFEVALLASAGIVAICAVLALRVPRVLHQA